MGKIEIERTAILASVNNSLEMYQLYRENSEQFMGLMRKVKDENEAIAVIKTVSFNKKMMEIFLDRAAVVLQLIGVFDFNTDPLDYETIKQKLKEVAS